MLGPEREHLPFQGMCQYVFRKGRTKVRRNPNIPIYATRPMESIKAFARERTDDIQVNRAIYLGKAAIGAVAMAAMMMRSPFSLTRATAISASCITVPLGIILIELGARADASVAETTWGFSAGAQMVALVTAFRLCARGDFKELSSLGKAGVVASLGLSTAEFDFVKAYRGIENKDGMRT